MINYVTLIVAAVAAMVVGFVWYSEGVFGKTWMKLSGITKKDMKKAQKKGMGQTMLIAFIATLVTAYVLAYAVKLMQATTYAAGAKVGFWAWLGFVAPVLLGSVLWERKPVKLFAINAAHWLVGVAIMGAILAVWG